jgi:hypothetical protein
VSEDDRPRAGEPEDEESEQESSSTFVGTIYVPDDPHAAKRAEEFAWTARNIEKARQARERERAQESQDREEERQLRRYELAEAKRRAAAKIGRPPKKLPQRSVLDAEQELRKRAELPGEPRSGPFTYAAIARRVKLNYDRLVEIEELMQLGWDLRESHPDFPGIKTTCGYRRHAKPRGCCVRTRRHEKLPRLDLPGFLAARRWPVTRRPSASRDGSRGARPEEGDGSPWTLTTCSRKRESVSNSSTRPGRTSKPAQG